MSVLPRRPSVGPWPVAACLVAVALLLVLLPAARSVAAAESGSVRLEGTYSLLLDTPRAGAADVRQPVLKVGSRVVELHGAALARLRPGQQVAITGKVDGHVLEVSGARAVASSAPAAVAPRTSVLILLTSWSSPDAVTPERAVAQIGGADDAWYRQVSYGQSGLDADATPWLTVPAPTACDAVAMYALAGQAAAAARAAGFELTHYDRTMIYFPATTLCAWAGLGEVGGRTTWINGSMNTRVTVHELGHNDGLLHAHALTCAAANGTPVALGPDCTEDEYGDPFDAMGAAPFGVGHFDALHAGQLGWMTGRTRDASGGGSFTLAPIEAQQQALQALEIRVSAGTFWVEYRRPAGVDEWIGQAAGEVTDGVLVHRTAADGSSDLLDMHPAGAGAPGVPSSLLDAALAAGSAWTAPDRSLTLKVGGAGPEGVEVTVVTRPPAMTTGGFDRGSWSLADDNVPGAPTHAFTFGAAGDEPVAGDWDGDGRSTIGVVRGHGWLLRNANSSGPPDLAFSFGRAGDQVLVGDWDGNGTWTPGVRRGSVFYLSNSSDAGDADIAVAYGRASDEAFVGDWDGNGTFTPGVRRGNVLYLKNSFSAGDADIVLAFGLATDELHMGDWDGDGTWTPGLLRDGSQWYLDNSFASGPADMSFPDQTPGAAVVGDWDGRP